jgi:hypothetical protein
MKNIIDHVIWAEDRKALKAAIVKENLVSSQIIFPTEYDDLEKGFPEFKNVQLVLETYKRGQMSSLFTRCIVKESDNTIGEVVRNHNSFPFLLFKHSNGSRYLACGIYYQGYTLMNVDTGGMLSYLPSGILYGTGWCINEFTNYSVETNSLTVKGKVLYGDQFNVVYDLSNTVELPWNVLSKTPIFPEDINNEVE